jgi:two-component system chemotaxis response regulator CheB
MTQRQPTPEPATSAPRPVVIAIGSSADGYSNLTTILSALPPDFPGSILIVQHRTFPRPSILPRLLAKVSKLPVKEAGDGEKMAPGTIYLAPIGRHLIVQDGHTGLTDTAPVNFVRPSVDVLFETIAKIYGPRAIGVVLSGGGSDGARGLQAIRHAGGHTIVQSPTDARIPGMPTAAIGKDGIEFVVDAAQIGPLLARLAAEKPGREAADCIGTR